MSESEIRSLFAQFARLNVGVIGDFAVDLYCTLQTRTGELSLETGRTVFWGSRPSTSLGAAGNVVQNLAALGIGNIRVFGCVGNDLFGREMQHLFQSLHVDTQQLRVLPVGWDTCVYSKPNLNGREHNRLDFGTANQLTDDDFSLLLLALEKALPDLDVLIINQQFANPLLTTSRTEQLNNLITRHKNIHFVADMRQTGQYIRGATLKVNTAELAHFLEIPLPENPDLTWCEQQGNRFRQRTQGPLLITRGPAGILYLDEQETHSVNGLPLTGELDTVGAGDTVVAAWAACAGAGAMPAQALELANLAAGVTVQKLAQTGTATLSEILSLHQTQSAYDQRSF